VIGSVAAVQLRDGDAAEKLGRCRELLPDPSIAKQAEEVFASGTSSLRAVLRSVAQLARAEAARTSVRCASSGLIAWQTQPNIYDSHKVYYGI
jgi:hypothetical protein